MTKKVRISFALRCSIIYAILGGVWILWSDRLLSITLQNADRITQFQTYKGWGFVIITALFLYYFLNNESKRHRITEKAQEALYQIAVATISAPALDDLYRSIHEALTGVMPAKNFYIALYDPETNLISFPYYVDQFDSPPPPTPLQHGLTEYVLRTKAPVLVSPKVFQELHERGEVSRVGTPSLDWLGVPLIVEGNTIGVMVIQTYEEGVRFRQRELDILQFVSSQAALAIDRKSAQESLAASEERYRKLVDLSPDAIAINCEGKVVYINPAGLRIMGASDPEQILGRVVLDFVHPDFRELALQRVKEGIENKKPQPPIEEKFLRLDGTTIDVEVTSIPRTYQSKPAVQVIIRDITERKQSQAVQLALYQITSSVVTSSNLDDLYGSIHKALASIMPAKNFYIALHDPEKSRLVFPYYVDEHDHRAERRTGKGLTEYVLRTQKPLLASPEVFDRLQASGEVESIGAACLDWLGVPLIDAGQTIGVMVVQTYDEGARYGQRDLELLQFVSSQVANAIQRKQAQAILERQFKELSILHAMTLAESSTTNIDEVFNRVTQIIGDLLFPENCGILLINNTRDGLWPHPSYRGTNPNNLGTQLPLSQGISGRVARTGKAVRVGDVSKDPDYYEVTKEIRSELCVPIVIGEQMFGVLNVESKTLNAFQEEDERLLLTVAGGLAATIERQRLFEVEQAQLQREAAMLDLMRVAASTLNLEQVLATILGHLTRLIPSESGTIQLLEGDCLRITAAIGFNTGDLELGSLLPLAQFPINTEVIRQERTVRIDDVTNDDRFMHIPGTENVTSMLALPLVFKNRVIGMITLDSSQKSHFKRQDEELGLAVANHAAIAIENARLYEAELRRRRDAENLREAASALTKTFQPVMLYNVVLDSLTNLVDFDLANIELVSGENIEIVAERGNLIDNQNNPRIEPFNRKKWTWLTESRRPGIIPDIQKDHRIEIPASNPELKSWMGIPLFAQDKLIGFLNVYHQVAGYYSEEHAALGQTFADQAAIAIENAQLIQEERRRTRIIEALAEIANEIATSGEEVILLDKVAEKALDLLEASHVAIYLLQADNETVDVVTAIGTYSEELLSHTLKVGQGITGNIIASGTSEIINDTTIDPRTIKVPGTLDEDGSQETMMSSALILHGKSIGAINVWRLRSKGFFNDPELNFLISIAHQASISIELGRLLQETRKQARQAMAIAEVGREISSTLQLDVVLERIASFAKELLRAETSAVHLYEPETATLRAIAAIGHDAQEIKNDPLKLGSGIVGNIALNKIGEIVNDTGADPRAHLIKGTDLIPFEHIIAVPVLHHDELTGMVVVWRIGKGEEFILAELEFLRSLAQQAAIAIENARLFQSEQKRRQEAETLQLAATAITSSLEPKQVLETILIALQQVVPYDSATMFLLENSHVRIVAAKGFPDNDFLVGQLFPSSNALLTAIHESGQPLVLEDAQTDPRFEKWVDAISIHGWMGVPLIARGKIIGYFTIDSFRIGTFNQGAVLLAQTFAHQASAALENARLYNETRQRLEEQEIISRISVALRSAQDSEEMLPILLDEIMATIGSNTCAIWLLDEDRNELVLKLASGWLANIPKRNFKTTEGIVGRVYLTGKPHVSDELAREPLTHPDNVGFFTEGWGGITIPIQTRTSVIGVLGVALPSPRRIEAHHVRLLTTISEIAGNAIHRVNLYRQSEEQVQHLTALREVDTAIASSFDLNVTLNILAHHILTQMEADAVSIFDLQPDQLTLSYLAGAGFSTRSIMDMKINVGDGLAGKAILGRKDIYIGDLSAEKAFRRRRLLSEDKFVSYYAVPLVSKGYPQGLLEVFFKHRFIPTLEWIDFIQTLAGQATIAIDNARLFEDLQRSNQELSLAYDTTLEGWGKALELRDKETQGHTRRVTDLTLKLARQLGLDEGSLLNIHRGVLLHDIGKMGVSDYILHKEGPLTNEERIVMENHPTYAYELLSTIPYLKSALDIPYCHHEWWNGSGYPRKLKGEQIPIAARIFAIVDVWDALLSNRPYRKAWTKQKAIKYLSDHGGTQFDPTILDLFLKMVKLPRRKT